MNWLKRLFGARTAHAATSSMGTLEAMALLTRLVLDGKTMGLDLEVVAVADTNSMLPTFDSNAVLLAEVCPYASLKEGDIAIYRSGTMLIVHRLNERTSKGWRALGDGNGTQDPELVTPENFYKRVAGIVYCKE